ncbi:hypothetical protein NDU88_003097 [Pleurodeles waltl]|uniref:Integrase catalytic domain-containing protein n=1 Tax=Pleurodeles waltl TaxID=8319 RepID=A0AAV7M2G8_PLEWA|nr:hypothetical protein NDU88_003097 [Pleurodeles waltl]
MADRKGSQGCLEPGTMAQTTAKRRGKGRGKPVPEVPAVVDGVPEEEAPEPTGEDIGTLGDLPELAGWQVECGPTREEFCKAQKECPTLQGMRKQASAQAADLVLPARPAVKQEKGLMPPLIPLPVVGTPFERVGIDNVGPLDPKTALGNRFILGLLDHATRYPEAIPLRTVTAPVVTRTLMGIFTRVGFPKEIVSDRGTNLMSAYMKSIWDACGVTYKFTTPYHPQSNGLVERFNKTLKGMIGGLPEALRRKWDVLLPCLLFAYREVPQKGEGFSPFELLCGYSARGPLSIVKEGLEKAPKAPPQDVVSYMLALRNQMTRFWKEAKSNLEDSQELIKRWYDQKATLVEFQPGDKVWVMEPVEPRALQDR